MEHTVENRILKHELKVQKELRDMAEKLQNQESQIKELTFGYRDIKESQNRVERKLESAETDRKSFSDYVSKEVREIKNYFKLLAEKTEANSDLISKHEADLAAKRQVDEALETYKAPMKKVRERIILTAVGVITVAVLTVMWKLVTLALQLDSVIFPTQ